MEKTDKIIIDGTEYLIEPSAENVLYGSGTVKDELDSLNNRISEKLHLHILVMGNSYTADSFCYLPFILKSYGITVTMAFYMRPAGSLDLLYGEYTSTMGAFNLIDTRTDSYWTQPASPGAQGIVRYAHEHGFHWDIIVLQQSSGDSITASRYSHAEDIVKLINNDMDGSYILGWNINHTRKKDGNGNVDESFDNPSAVLTNCKDVIDALPVDIIFPYGTAIFNARQNQTLAQLGGGGNLWSYDLIHLNEGFPCYLANLTNVEALFRKFYPQFSVLGDRNYATTSWVEENRVTQYLNRVGDATNADYSALNCYLAQKAAVMAVRNPFEITAI